MFYTTSLLAGDTLLFTLCFEMKFEEIIVKGML